MNYKEYFKICREKYKDNSPPLQEFYNKPVRIFPDRIFDLRYYEIVNILSEKIKTEFDASSQTGIMIECEDMWKYEREIGEISKYLVPHLEKTMYGCNLLIDKVYIYRTMKVDKRTSSYLWHYDNNPSEIVKNIIYLNDVNKDNSPFEYLSDKDGNGIIAQPTRTGPKNWVRAPNNSRITLEQLFKLNKAGYKGRKILGKQGTALSFNNDTIHRANPIKKGYRDVLNIRVKPTLQKKEKYIDKRWTSGYEKTGVVSPYPDKF